ncbi:hypothetical protein [Escherichia coli]
MARKTICFSRSVEM